MARDFEADEGGSKGSHGRREYIDALLLHRRPPSIDDTQLLKRIESKTAQHRTPFSANISRKHASILSALSDEERPTKLGHKRSLTPTREASRRRAFEVFEWDRDKEPFEPSEAVEVPTADEGPDLPGWPQERPASSGFLMALGTDEAGQGPDEEADAEAPEEGDGPPLEPEPEEVPEASDLISEDLLVEAQAITPSDSEEPVESQEDEGTAPDEGPVAEAHPAAAETDEDEVVLEGKPGIMPREGGEFPADMMEPIDEAGTEGSARLDLPRREELETAPALTFEHETDFTDDSEEPAGETETLDSVEGLRHAARWPSDTGLELHIDGFEHISATSDLCPRCGRRVTARNRLLSCNDCGTVACESCEMRTTAKVDAPYYYDWRFELPLCVNCYEKAFNIQKLLAKAKASLGMGNHTYAFYHAQQALRTDPSSPYAKDAQRIIEQVDRRRREAAEQDEAWKRQRAKLSRTTVVRED